MLNQQNPLLSAIFGQVLNELKGTKIPKSKEELQTSLTELLKDVDINNLHKEIPISSLLNSLFSQNQEKVKEEEEEEEELKVDVTIKEVVAYYNSVINETFIHTKKRTKYVLLELLNVQSTDIDKFPILVSYYDKQLKTKWCRPLVEFHNKFKLVQ